MAHSKLYVRLMNSKEWVKLRARKLTENPLCERCLQQGHATAARCVHHVIPVESGRDDQECHDICMRWSNLQALCYHCHAEIHKEERSYTKEGHKQRADERLEQWIARHERRK